MKNHCSEKIPVKIKDSAMVNYQNKMTSMMQKDLDIVKKTDSAS